MSYEVVEAGGDTRGLGVGALFTLVDFPRDDQNKEYLITSAQYHIHTAAFESGGGGGSDRFNASYTLIDSKTQFRSPLNTPRPRVQGPQTAIVVGESGDEITVDKYGRVKVQFHWDREGKNDENSSCWVRVAQIWAGTRLGRHPHPPHRAGGDRRLPRGGSRPADHHRQRLQRRQHAPLHPPRQQDAERRSRSRSTLGGAPSQLQRAAVRGQEGLGAGHFHAEKDLTSLIEHDEDRNVGNDRTTEIAHDETITVGNNRTETVSKQESITIGGDRQESVGKSETVTIGTTRALTVGTNETIQVGGQRSDSVAKDETSTVGGNQSLSVGKNQSIDVGGGLTLSVGKDEGVSVGGNLTVSVGKGESRDIGKKLAITAGDQITLTSGSASITLKSNGDITINGANITLKGSGKITVQASSDVIIKGSKVSQN